MCCAAASASDVAAACASTDASAVMDGREVVARKRPTFRMAKVRSSGDSRAKSRSIMGLARAHKLICMPSASIPCMYCLTDFSTADGRFPAVPPLLHLV